MANRRKKDSRSLRWVDLAKSLESSLPHLAGWYGDLDDFNELRIKTSPDGTILTVAKGYMGDGTPSVCFGVGYDVAAALLAIDATIGGGRWRKDKPWKPEG